MTPACRALEAAGVTYTLHPYDHDPAAPSFGDEAVAALGVEADRVFKTLMADVDGELVVAVVAVPDALDLKALARLAGSKRAEMADVAAAERSSGYVAGGISPFGQRQRRRTFVDDSAMLATTMFVSAGRRGLDLEIEPAQLIEVTDAVVGRIGR